MGFKLSEKAKNVIQAVAPTLGTALGGPLGGMAGSVIAAAVGGKDSREVEDALLVQKPETLLALRNAEIDFQLKLKELGIEEDRIAMADRVSARDMAKIDMRPQMLLSGVFVVGYFCTLYLMLDGSLELTNVQQALVNTLMGVLTAGVIKILDFWFGSTAGSLQKSAMLYQSRPAET